jgi:hypothetical protein
MEIRIDSNSTPCDPSSNWSAVIVLAIWFAGTERTIRALFRCDEAFGWFAASKIMIIFNQNILWKVRNFAVLA